MTTSASGAIRHEDDPALRELLLDQDGVVGRVQLLALGLPPHFARRMLRRERWVQLHRGVYLTHTGEATWRQRAWAAVLAVGPPAALCHDSALRAVEGPGRRGRDDAAPLHVAVDRKRSVQAPYGVVLHHLVDLEDRVQWHTRPPRVRVEEALIEAAAQEPTDLRAIARLADAVQARLTTADRLLAAAARRNRLRRRHFLTAVLHDVRAGTCSVLEHAYLTRVERAHGLPPPQRQRPTTGGRPGFRDVDHGELGLIVELDGRLGHSSTSDRDRDLERDLDAAVAEDRRTVRLGWGQVLTRPCSTAAKVARLLRRAGWEGCLTRCPDCRP